MNGLIAACVSLLGLIANEERCEPCSISDTGLALIRNFEGYSPFVYKDIAGKETIGFGHLILPGESFKEPLLPEAANELLRDDVGEHEGHVNGRVTVELQQHQFDALTSWTFNLGPGSLSRSTMLKRVNARRHQDVPPEMLRWNKARQNGVLKTSRGLTRRRKAEGAMYAGE